MLRALWQLFTASLNLLQAKIRGATNPCPPHEYDPRWDFCLKCGTYKDRGWFVRAPQA